MSETIIVALLSLIGTLAGSYFASRRSTALIAYRLEQLEEKVNKHNQVVERTYKLEGRVDSVEQALEDHEELYGEKIKVANHRIEDLEHRHE